MPKYTREELQEAVKNCSTIKEALIMLGLRAAGGNYKTFKHYCSKYEIDCSHFNPTEKRARTYTFSMEEILVKDSTYCRTKLKKRLYKEGFKSRECEMCGQGEEWRGKKISLILDHINGVWNDNRLENLRIVCPNCNATLDTHAGKNTAKVRAKRNELPLKKDNRRPWSEKIEWPDNETLREMLADSNYSALGRKLGVSDNAIRKRLSRG